MKCLTLTLCYVCVFEVMEFDQTQVIIYNLSDDDQDGTDGKLSNVTLHVTDLPDRSNHEQPLPEFRLNFGENVIGRDESCDICIPSKVLSKYHAAIYVHRDGQEIYDLKSRNGTRRDKLFLKANTHYELRVDNQISFGNIQAKIQSCQDKDEATCSETDSESILLFNGKVTETAQKEVLASDSDATDMDSDVTPLSGAAEIPETPFALSNSKSTSGQLDQEENNCLSKDAEECSDEDRPLSSLLLNCHQEMSNIIQTEADDTSRESIDGCMTMLENSQCNIVQQEANAEKSDDEIAPTQPQKKFKSDLKKDNRGKSQPETDARENQSFLKVDHQSSDSNLNLYLYPTESSTSIADEVETLTDISPTDAQLLKGDRKKDEISVKCVGQLQIISQSETAFDNDQNNSKLRSHSQESSEYFNLAPTQPYFTDGRVADSSLDAVNEKSEMAYEANVIDKKATETNPDDNSLKIKSGSISKSSQIGLQPTQPYFFNSKTKDHPSLATQNERLNDGQGTDMVSNIPAEARLDDHQHLLKGMSSHSACMHLEPTQPCFSNSYLTGENILKENIDDSQDLLKASSHTSELSAYNEIEPTQPYPTNVAVTVAELNDRGKRIKGLKKNQCQVNPDSYQNVSKVSSESSACSNIHLQSTQIYVSNTDALEEKIQTEDNSPTETDCDSQNLLTSASNDMEPTQPYSANEDLMQKEFSENQNFSCERSANINKSKNPRKSRHQKSVCKDQTFFKTSSQSSMSAAHLEPKQSSFLASIDSGSGEDFENQADDFKMSMDISDLETLPYQSLPKETADNESMLSTQPYQKLATASKGGARQSVLKTVDYCDPSDQELPPTQPYFQSCSHDTNANNCKNTFIPANGQFNQSSIDGLAPTQPFVECKNVVDDTKTYSPPSDNNMLAATQPYRDTSPLSDEQSKKPSSALTVFAQDSSKIDVERQQKLTTELSEKATCSKNSGPGHNEQEASITTGSIDAPNESRNNPKAANKSKIRKRSQAVTRKGKAKKSIKVQTYRDNISSSNFENTTSISAAATQPYTNISPLTDEQSRESSSALTVFVQDSSKVDGERQQKLMTELSEKATCSKNSGPGHKEQEANITAESIDAPNKRRNDPKAANKSKMRKRSQPVTRKGKAKKCIKVQTHRDNISSSNFESTTSVSAAKDKLVNSDKSPLLASQKQPSFVKNNQSLAKNCLEGIVNNYQHPPGVEIDLLWPPKNLKMTNLSKSSKKKFKNCISDNQEATNTEVIRPMRQTRRNLSTASEKSIAKNAQPVTRKRIVNSDNGIGKEIAYRENCNRLKSENAVQDKSACSENRLSSSDQEHPHCNDASDLIPYRRSNRIKHVSSKPKDRMSSKNRQSKRAQSNKTFPLGGTVELITNDEAGALSSDDMAVEGQVTGKRGKASKCSDDIGVVEDNHLKRIVTSSKKQTRSKSKRNASTILNRDKDPTIPTKSTGLNEKNKTLSDNIVDNFETGKLTCLTSNQEKVTTMAENTDLADTTLGQPIRSLRLKSKRAASKIINDDRDFTLLVPCSTSKKQKDNILPNNSNGTITEVSSSADEVFLKPPRRMRKLNSSSKRQETLKDIKSEQSVVESMFSELDDRKDLEESINYTLSNDRCPNVTLKNQAETVEVTDDSGSPQKSVNIKPNGEGRPLVLGKRRAPASKIRVAFTGGTNTPANVKIVNDLGGKIVESVTDSTVLVSDKFKRTVKTLCFIAQGKPIVSSAWLKKSKSMKAFPEVYEFMLNDKQAQSQYDFDLKLTLEMARNRPLLVGFKIHVTEAVKPPPTEMKDIIHCAGAKFLAKYPTKEDPTSKTLIISCSEDLPRFNSLSTPVVSNEFLLTGLLRYDFNHTQYIISKKGTIATTEMTKPRNYRVSRKM